MPIVSACSCPTEHISEYLDVALQPLVRLLPTDIKLSTHAFNLIEGIHHQNQNFEPKYVFTMAVTSLYTCIPHSGGLKALQYFLNKRSTLHPPTDMLYRRAKFVLTKNAFTFRDDIFFSDEWCSDGSQLLMSIFMGHFEQKLLQQYSKPVSARDVQR